MRVALRLPAALALLLALSLPASAAPDPAAVELLQRVRAAVADVRAFEADVLMTRMRPEFLKAFYTPTTLNMGGVVGFRRPDDFDLYLVQGGSRFFRFDSRGGFGLRYSALVRLGEGSPDFPPPLQPTPEPGLGFDDFGPDTTNLRPLHPLVFLFPPELWEAAPGEEPQSDGAESLYGTSCARLRVPQSGGAVLRYWVDRTSYQVLRLEATPAGGGAVLQADYRRTGAAPPAWTDVEVKANHAPVYTARMSRPVVNGTASRLPDLSLVLRKPGGDVTRAAVPLLMRLSGEVKGVLLVLGAVLLGLAVRFLSHRFGRQRFSREVILLDTLDGLWARRLKRLGFPVTEFTPEIVTEELHGLERGATVESTRPPRAIVVAPEACANARAHRYLLKAFVEEGGRVLLLAHTSSFPFEVQTAPLSESGIRQIFFEPDGAWHRIPGAEAGAVASGMGCGVYYLSVDGAPVQRELVGFANEAGLRMVAVGVAHRGRGEWILCQLAFPVSSVGLRTPAGRMLRDLMDLLQHRREIEEEDIWGRS